MNSAPYIPGCVCMSVDVVVPGSINSKRTGTGTGNQNSKIKITPLSTEYPEGNTIQTGIDFVEVKKIFTFLPLCRTWYIYTYSPIHFN